MRELVNDWPGDCKIIHSRPRHPQTNGLVEQSNGTVKTMLSAMMVQIGLDKEESKDWPSLLPRVMFNLNTRIWIWIIWKLRHSATKFSPFQLAFKQLPNLGNQVNEVEMTEESEDKIIRWTNFCLWLASHHFYGNHRFKIVISYTFIQQIIDQETSTTFSSKDITPVDFEWRYWRRRKC